MHLRVGIGSNVCMELAINRKCGLTLGLTLVIKNILTAIKNEHLSLMLKEE